MRCIKKRKEQIVKVWDQEQNLKHPEIYRLPKDMNIKVDWARLLATTFHSMCIL